MGNLFRVNYQKADPDILYIVDRTAVMEHRSNINAASVENPLLRQTKAWKNGRVILSMPMRGTPRLQAQPHSK